MNISDNGLHLIEQFEGYSPTPYWDPYGHVWTRGYGETEGITRASPRITRGEAERRLRDLIESRYEWAIRNLNVPLSQNQWDALASFIWNLGPGILTGDLRQALVEKRWNTVAAMMLAYDHAGGVVLPGLKRRRELESRLFLDAMPAFMPADEARWEHQYDQLAHRHGPWARTRRRVLRRYMARRRHEIVTRAQHDGWNRLNRVQRYWKLWARTE